MGVGEYLDANVPGWKVAQKRLYWGEYDEETILTVTIKSLHVYKALISFLSAECVIEPREDPLEQALRKRGIRIGEWNIVNTDWMDLESVVPCAEFHPTTASVQQRLDTLVDRCRRNRRYKTRFGDIPDDAYRNIIATIAASCVDADKCVLSDTVGWRTVKSLLFTCQSLREATLDVLENILPLSGTQFDVFLRIVFGRSSVCCLGSAGTGKSHTCRVAMRVMRSLGTNVVATAPTRRTAAALSGSTIAKFLGTRPRDLDEVYSHDDIFVAYTHTLDRVRQFNPCMPSGVHELLCHIRTYKVAEDPGPEAGDDDDTQTDEEEEDRRPWIPIFFYNRAEEISEYDVVVVDEVFMLNPFRCEQFRSVVRQYCESFGRAEPRYVFLGDPWQTEAFSTDELAINLWESKNFFFQTPWFESLFRDSNGSLTNIFELTDVKRSSDPVFHRLLFNLRNNKALSVEDVRAWHKHTAGSGSWCRIGPNLPKGADGAVVPVALLGRRPQSLPKHDHDPPTSPCIKNFEKCVAMSSAITWTNYVSHDTPKLGAVPTKLPRVVSVALNVMVTVPEPASDNGSNTRVTRTHGRVVRIEPSVIYVKPLTGVVIPVLRSVDENEDGRRVQFDVKMASGLTVHSTQGMTFSDPFAVYVEKSALWTRNMVYTALSRSTHMSLITLCGRMSDISCRVDKALIAFQAELTARMKRVPDVAA